LKSLLLLLLLLPCTVTAAPAPARTFRILFLEGPDSAPQTLQLFDGKSSTEVDLPRMNFSKVYPLRPGTLKLSLLPTAIDDPEKLPEGAPSVVLPESSTDFYLLLTSDPSNKVAPVRIQAINADPSRLKKGAMLWYNLTDLTVGGTVGSRKLVIAPLSSKTLEPPASGNTDYPVDLAFRIAGKEANYPLCETKWRHDPRSRSLAFIIANEGYRSPRILVFPDFREQEQRKNDDGANQRVGG